jgi:hypothetical protein
MAVYGSVRHQNNIIWTSEASVHIIFFWWRTVHILPYDPQCHELFAIYGQKWINNTIRLYFGKGKRIDLNKIWFYEKKVWISCSKRLLNYLAVIYFGFEDTWWRLIPKRVACTKFKVFVLKSDGKKCHKSILVNICIAIYFFF